MRIATVVGTVESTLKHPAYDGSKLLLCRVKPIRGETERKPVLAVDRVDAGVGDRVLILTEGNGVRQLLGGQPPIRSLIVGIIDEVEPPELSSE